MRQLHLGLLILSLLFFSLQSHASTADWQAFQSQATQAYQNGYYLQAEQAIQQAIRVAEKADNGDAYQASSLNMLAYIHSAQGQTDQALEVIAEAVQLSRLASGDHQEQLGQLLFNQGQLLQQANRFEQARLAYQQSIERYLVLMSTGEGKLWQAVLAQAQMLAQEHQYAEAENLINNALAGFAETEHYNPQPTSAPDRADLLLLLAQIHTAQQQPQQAIDALEQARQALQQSSQPDNERLLNALEHLANVYDDANQETKSTPLREQALLLRQQQTEPSLASVMHLNELALRHQLNENYLQADSLYQQALDLLSELNENESIEQALILGNLASLKLLQRDNTAALALFEQSLLLHDQLNQRPLEASQIASYTATIYYNQRQYEQAEPLFLQALALLDNTPSVDENSLLVALDNLAALYTSWGKPGKARPYTNRARALKTK
ncbi:tetratricopeptide repeat protein [Nitrincola sp.]|uniref:tetratricopeptide repeat protein n=1 Tax=Nitrincola sp. TaxID=1926584 RepID=UPI003A8EAC7A